MRNCPICGGILSEKVSTEVFTYKGKRREIPNYITLICDTCGESIVDKSTLKKTGKLLKDFQREVDQLLTGMEIKRIRGKLNLTQEEMAEILGGGLKAFARYESGQICQSRAMDNLLRILDKYPNVLQVILKKSEKFTIKKIIQISDYKQKYKTKSDKFNTELKELEYGT